MKCENCNREHDGSYGSGRFCSSFCSHSFGRKQQSDEANEKRKQKLVIHNKTRDYDKRVSHKNGMLGKKHTESAKEKMRLAHALSQEKWEEKWLSGEEISQSNAWGDVPKRVKKYLRKKYNDKCARCGWGETNPFTGKIPLEVDHIDGDYQNNRPENVTLLCPNCHSLTKTYRGANKGRGRPKTWKPFIDVPSSNG